MKIKKKVISKNQSKQGLKVTGMTLLQRYQTGYIELQTQVFNLRREVAELKRMQETKTEPKKEYKRSRAEQYYGIGPAGALRAQIDKYVPFDDFNYAIGNYYHTAEAAQHAKERQLILQELKDLAMELNAGEKIDWNDQDQLKYLIEMNGDVLEEDTRYFRRTQGVVYCLDQQFLEKALQKIGGDRLKKLFEEE